MEPPEFFTWLQASDPPDLSTIKKKQTKKAVHSKTAFLTNI
jgi:hypothetical protein